MRSIDYDDGMQSFAINGDESRIIRFNPADPNLLTRAFGAKKRLEEESQKVDGIELNPDGSTDDETKAGMLKAFDDILRTEVNGIFNADIYDTAFAGQSPLCIVGKDRLFLFEAFLKSAIGIVEGEVKKYDIALQESTKRIEKYTKGYWK